MKLRSTIGSTDGTPPAIRGSVKHCEANYLLRPMVFCIGSTKMKEKQMDLKDSIGSSYVQCLSLYHWSWDFLLEYIQGNDESSCELSIFREGECNV